MLSTPLFLKTTWVNGGCLAVCAFLIISPANGVRYKPSNAFSGNIFDPTTLPDPISSPLYPSGQLINKQKVGSKPFCPNGFIRAVPDLCLRLFVNLSPSWAVTF
jgi:hypothetical protein